MSLVQLESFVAVAEEAHVGRAARRMHVSQPPVSRRIQSLEDELGVKLFERTTKGMRLLPAGVVLLEHAQVILQGVRTAVESVRDTRSRQSGVPRRGGREVAGEFGRVKTRS